MRSACGRTRRATCLPHARYADTLKKIGFDGDCCTIEIFRPEYYEMDQEENVKKSAEGHQGTRCQVRAVLSKQYRREGENYHGKSENRRCRLRPHRQAAYQ